MRRKGRESLPTHIVDNAMRGSSSPFRTRKSGAIEEMTRGLSPPKSHKMDRAMDSILTSRPRMSNKSYWNSYHEIQDEMKRRRGNKIIP